MPATLRLNGTSVNAVGGEGVRGTRNWSGSTWELGDSGLPFGFCCQWLRDGG